MSFSNVKVGFPVNRSHRQNLRNGSHLITKSRFAKKANDRTKFLKNDNTVTMERNFIAGTPVASISDIDSGPLSFLSARQTMLLATVALVSVLVVWGLMRSNHQAVAHSYELSHLTQKKVTLLEDNRQLKAELARVSSLVHLESAAASTLGLVVPQNGQIVVID